MNSPPQAHLAGTSEHSTTPAEVDVDVLPAPPAIGPLIARAAARGAFTPRGSSTAVPHLPARRVVLRDQRVDVERLAAYARVCALTLRDTLPTTYLHVLTFPTQIHLLARPDFPLPALGMVHLSNEMTLLRDVRVTESLTLTSWAQHLRPHRKGATIEMVGEILVEGETVWRGLSTYLAKGAKVPDAPDDSRVLDNPDESVEAEGHTSAPTTADMRTWARWRCSNDLGRRYAAASGDVNPIHVNPIAARAFGFPRTIAHGMWTHARALAALEGRLEQRHTVEVTFRKPIVLPSTVNFRASDHASGHDFAVTDRAGERSHMVGRVTND